MCIGAWFRKLIVEYYSREPWHVCVKGDEELFEGIKLHVSSLLYLQIKSLSPHFHPYCLFPSPNRALCRLACWAPFLSIYLSGVYSSWSFTRLLLSSWGESVDRDGFTVVLGARRGPVDLQVVPAASRLASADSGYLHPQAPEKEAASPGPCRFTQGLALGHKFLLPAPMWPFGHWGEFQGFSGTRRCGCERWPYQCCGNVVTCNKLAALPHQPPQSKLMFYQSTSAIVGGREQCIGTASDWRNTALSLHLPKGFLWAFFLFEAAGWNC